MAVEMELVGIELERPPNIPCLLLREAEGDRRLLPIFIGSPEATAIAFALEEVETPRPMTHDLIKDILDELGARIERVVVTELRDSTFFAEIVVSQAGEVKSISARPSDAVAL
ncbi:MAG: bifunctional nuclease family protein, partial [Acidimicrobiales bacterium]